jgi:hypothetical protein
MSMESQTMQIESSLSAGTSYKQRDFYHVELYPLMPGEVQTEQKDYYPPHVHLYGIASTSQQPVQLQKLSAKGGEKQVFSGDQALKSIPVGTSSIPEACPRPWGVAPDPGVKITYRSATINAPSERLVVHCARFWYVPSCFDIEPNTLAQ